ncbi:fumarylacetoacetate hydrolase family protein [Niveispirillum fermenti]|uniref:fumarylacetoacetate hydrolase family protein n=1 Tax=Niveispirillum fermenti TaxID=1233113 RepID=UPI003A8B40EF
MRLVTYREGARRILGVLREDRILPVAGLSPGLPDSMEALLNGGPAAMAAVAAGLERHRGDGIALESADLAPPVPRPRKFLGIGFNYSSHVEEVRRKGIPIPDLSNQVWFNKQVSCLAGPYDPIELPASSEQLDYEAELGVVIGRRCRHVPPEQAHTVIAGYMVCNDVSVRDWQLKAPTAILGKSFDTHGPTGPWLTTADAVPDPQALSIRSWVDGELRQDGNTGELINGIAAMIAYISAVFTLEPGDILSTGSPCGVGAAFNPPRWLRAGQRVRVEIEGLGHIENRVVPEVPATRID